MICTGATYKDVVKMTFAKGAIDFHEGDEIDEKALEAPVWCCRRGWS
jgi:hypothetical protein